MSALVECVPNFSEGRRPEILDAIVAAALQQNGVALLDKEMDADHNRAVVTLVGAPEAVSEAAFRAVAKAAELLDMRTHKGEHPRMGATDVVPFVPISGMGLPECAALARQLGQRLGEELGIPIFLYESAASRPDRQNLADVRKGEYEGLTVAIGTDPDRRPDFGPEQMNLKTGATAVGARMPLVAFNAYLDTNRLSTAKAIANAIRFQSGGLRFVKAMGFDIQDRGCVQVSMNLVNYLKTPVFRVFEMIKSEAARWGTRVTSTEIVGLTPAKSLYDVAEHYLQLERFSQDQVLEEKLRTVLAGQTERTGWAQFADHVASSSPAPGGGSVAAAAGSLAAALSAMVCRLTIGKKKYADARPELESVLARAEELRTRLAQLVEKDTEAFDQVMAARKLPKDTDGEIAARDAAINAATREAAAVPLEVMRNAFAAMQLAQICAEKGNVNSVSDAGVASQMARAAVVGAGLNVKINLAGFEDKTFSDQMTAQMRELDEASARLNDEVLRTVHAKIDQS
ncbi:MAG TPA: glutamate formimidoyltransferase [Acidobacteriota bacterium]|nr:glutamate formimidoyltransferase [Acidobacteriota bacterium]